MTQSKQFYQMYRFSQSGRQMIRGGGCSTHQASPVFIIVLLLLLALALSGCSGGGGGGGGGDDEAEANDNTTAITEVNSPPELLTMENQSGAEGTMLTFTARATDPDPGETLRFSLDTDAPDGATIDPKTGVFSWTPTAAGTFRVTVQVTDESGLSDSETLTLNVRKMNSPPELQALGNQSGTEGAALNFTATATDPDSGDTLRFSLEGAPPKATIDATTGFFSWTPAAAGTFPVTVRVTDAGGLSDSEMLTITVKQVTVIGTNRPPVLRAPGNQNGPEQKALTFTATATDPDSGDTLRFSLEPNAPKGASIDSKTGLFRWTPTEAQGPGTFPVTVRVTDASGRSDTEDVTITVAEVNQPPVLKPIGRRTGKERAQLTFTAKATDPDLPANRLTFRLEAGAPKGASIDSKTGVFRWTPTGTGTFTVKARVTDAGGRSDSETFTITVTDRSFLVNSRENRQDTAPGDGQCKTSLSNGQCTLRAAIQEANALSGDDVINVPSGIYRLTKEDNNTNGKNGLPSVTSVITIKGAGADTTRIERGSSAPDFRIFHVAATGNLTLDGITIAGGAVTNDTGGGLYNAGTLTLVKSTVRNNMTFFTDPAFSADGGGIFNRGSLTLRNSTVRENAAGSDFFADGGGIFSNSKLTLTNSSVSENVAGYGGGIANRGKATLLNSTISVNGATDDGGGIDNDGTLTLTSSTVSENICLDFGGGISNTGTLMLINSTVSDNGAPDDGGGIGNKGTLTLTNSTVSDNDSRLDGGGIFNSGGTMELTHTIVAGNIVAGNKTEMGSDCSGTLTSLGHNLVGTGTGCPSDGTGDQTADPLVVFTTVLGPLQSNGGPTETHALVPGSPAIDAGGSNCPQPATDQRGERRPQDGDGDGKAVCDIGALEYIPKKVSTAGASAIPKL